MHECPICGEECDCDGDDTGGLPVPANCPHICIEPGCESEDEAFGFDLEDYEQQQDILLEEEMHRFWDGIFDDEPTQKKQHQSFKAYTRMCMRYRSKHA